MNSITIENTSKKLNKFKQYTQEHWSIAIILISYLYTIKTTSNIISFIITLPFWILLSNYIDSAKQSEKIRAESYYRNKIISEELERTKSNILNKYDTLLTSNKYDELVTELKNIK